jgi:acetate kinase
VVFVIVLTVNAGSSSLRVHVVRSTDEQVLESEEIPHPADSAEARAALDEFLGRIDLGGLDAVAHRLVHGGPELTAAAVADKGVRQTIADACSLDPQHGPKTLALLDLLGDRLPEVPHVVCPDTEFHLGLPEVARTYALPEQWRARWGLRRYGFHGLSFGWALRRSAHLLGRPVAELNLLIAHLSGGSSVVAVRGGESVDTSMGFTPLEGLVMAKRSGTVDPGMLLWLLREEKLTVTELEDGLYGKSGLLGLSGSSDDTRELVRDARDDVRASFAMAVFEHRVRRELAAVAAGLDRVDALVFTGDIGWDQPEVAESVSAGLGVLGLRGGLSRDRESDGVISPEDADIPVVVLRSREELQLAAVATAKLAAPIQRGS